MHLVIVICCVGIGGVGTAAAQTATGVEAGYWHTCAMTTGGGATCWGANGFGRLGDGTTTNRPVPVPVSGLDSGVAAMTAGDEHTCALTDGGGVMCWGANSHGSLGDGTTEDRWTPASVSALASGVVAIAAGTAHTCALTTGGGVKCWGQNGALQLGVPNSISGPTYRTTAVQVSTLTSGVAAIAAGGAHSCALTDGGAVLCWGFNSRGQLGDGTTQGRFSPATVSGLESGVVAIAAGLEHTCALTDGGGVTCWGWNGHGQVGDGTEDDRWTPAPVTGLGSGVAAIGAGPLHTCAVTDGGGAMCWGLNENHQLGDETTEDRSTPTPVSGLASGVAAITAGAFHTCVLTSGGGVKCWGGDTDGQLGIGPTMVAPTPISVYGFGGAITVSAITPDHGSANGGTVVTITGTYVLEGATVTIGGVAATDVSVIDRTEITATTGVHAAGGASDVVVQNPDGLQATLVGGFTYEAMPAAVTVHPSNQTVRAGRTATFTAAASGVPTPTVQWQVSTDGGAIWGDIGGATSPTYAFTATAADHGKRFRASFTNGSGGALSAAGILTVRSVSGGDFNGDAVTDIGVYRPATGMWYIRNQPAVQFGDPGDVQVAGDYNGDGGTDAAVYRPKTGMWFARNIFALQFGDPGDVPVLGDFNGDGTADVAIYRPATGYWYVRNQFAVQFGGPDFIPVVGDYNGDGTDDVAVYRPSTGFWYVRNQLAIQFGGPGSVPAVGDYDGDGSADLAVYRPSDGMWLVRNQFTIGYGDPGDIPLARDWNGDGTTDIAVYRPGTGEWRVRNQFVIQHGDAMDQPILPGPKPLSPSNGDYDADNVTDVAVYRASTGMWYVRNTLSVRFGDASDTPVPADYTGDGRMDVAVYRPSTGTWYVRNQFSVQLGIPGDMPVPGDYNGDGVAEVAVYRPSTGFWYIRNQPGVQFGEPGDIPVPGDYNGDGATDIAVYRPSTGFWLVRNQLPQQFGGSGYVPVPGDYNGDGLTDLAVYHTSSGTWSAYNQFVVQFGDATDTPVPGDYNGDGTTDVAVYRQSTGTWYARNQFAIQFGDAADVPVVRIGPNQ